MGRDRVESILRFIIHPFVYRTALLTLVYWLTGFYLLSADQIIQIANYIMVSVGFSVLIVYAPAAWFAYKKGIRDRHWQRIAYLSTGISLIALTAVLVRGWSIVYRISGWEWMKDSPWIGYFITLAAWGYIYHLIPPDSVEQGLLGRPWVRACITIGIGLLFAAILIGIGLDPQINPSN